MTATQDNTTFPATSLDLVSQASGPSPDGNGAPRPATDEAGTLRRSTRRRVMTQKVRDMLPDSSGSGLQAVEGTDSSPQPITEVHHPPRIRHIVIEKFRTIISRFGLQRIYQGFPSRVPDTQLDPTQHVPTNKPPRHTRLRRTISEIIAPLPNLSAWRQYHHFWSYPTQTRTSRSAMQDILRRPSFSAADAAAANFDKIDNIIAARQPWSDPAEGWRQSTITIGIPTGHRPTEASRRYERTARSRIRCHETVDNVPAEHPIL